MSVALNLLELVLDQSKAIKVFRRPYDGSISLDTVRKQLRSNGIVTRLGDELWGYALPNPILKEYGFQPDTTTISDVDPRFVNSLIRHYIKEHLEKLGYRRAGFDKFERLSEIAFSLGNDDELIARPRWIIRPFSLPSNESNVYTLLLNPRVAYRLKYNFVELDKLGLRWQEFGEKIRAMPDDQTKKESNPWEEAHTALVVEDKGYEGLVCEWKNGEQHLVSLDYCWLLASADNRYSYLKRRYSGSRGEQLSKLLKTKEDDFFTLDKAHERILSLIRTIDQIQLEKGLTIRIVDFLETKTMDSTHVSLLRPRPLTETPGDARVEELMEVNEDDDPEEFVQLSLF